MYESIVQGTYLYLVHSTRYRVAATQYNDAPLARTTHPLPSRAAQGSLRGDHHLSLLLMCGLRQQRGQRLHRERLYGRAGAETRGEGERKKKKKKKMYSNIYKSHTLDSDRLVPGPPPPLYFKAI